MIARGPPITLASIGTEIAFLPRNAAPAGRKSTGRPPAYAAADARLRLCALANVATNLSVPRTSSPSRR